MAQGVISMQDLVYIERRLNLWHILNLYSQYKIVRKCYFTIFEEKKSNMEKELGYGEYVCSACRRFLSGFLTPSFLLCQPFSQLDRQQQMELCLLSTVQSTDRPTDSQQQGRSS